MGLSGPFPHGIKPLCQLLHHGPALRQILGMLAGVPPSVFLSVISWASITSLQNLPHALSSMEAMPLEPWRHIFSLPQLIERRVLSKATSVMHRDAENG